MSRCAAEAIEPVVRDRADEHTELGEESSFQRVDVVEGAVEALLRPIPPV